MNTTTASSAWSADLMAAYGLLVQERFTQAREALTRIVQRGGADRSRAVCLLAGVYQQEGLYSDAIRVLAKGLQASPQDALILAHLADLWDYVGEFNQAIDAANRSLAVNPSNARLAVKRANWRVTEPVSARAMRREYEQWAELFLPPAPPVTVRPTIKPLRGRKLRVGYVSGDLRRHALFFLIAPYFHHHDHEQVEVHVFMTKPGDSYTEALKAVVPHWHQVHDVPNDELKALIQRHDIDVLVDLSGHTEGHRLEMFHQRVAPVQATWFGFIPTLGMRTMDYRLTDGLAVPHGAEDQYVETPYRLACFTAYEMPHGYNGPYPAPHHANGYVTMVSLNHERKIGDDALKLWKRILQRNPRTGLIIVSSQATDVAARIVFERRLRKHGLPAERVAVVGQLPLEQYMNMSAVADFALDSYPISGGVTTFHCLAMGLPVLTVRPQEPIALYAYSANTLETVGMSECIAPSPDALVELATQWIQQPQRIDQARTKARPALLSSPYLQHEARTRELEAAFRDMALARQDSQLA